MKNILKKVIRKIVHGLYYVLLILFNCPRYQWKKKWVSSLYSYGTNVGVWEKEKIIFKESFSKRPFLQKTNLSYYRYLLDFRLCYLFLGVEHENYFGFQLYKHGWKYRNNCVTRHRMNTLSRIVNDKEQLHYLGTKSETAQLYCDFFGRKWASFPNCSKEQFLSTFSNCKRIIVKPERQYGGAGIEVFSVDNHLDELYQMILGKGNVIVEEYYEQKGLLHDINPSSLNTLRVLTFRVSDDKVYLLSAFLRAGGKDAIVDNFHAGGYCYGIDIETGILLWGNRSDFECNVKYHPSTMVKVEGMPVPCWKEVVELCKKAHSIAPKGLDWIGWDICASENEAVIIEANTFAGSHGPKDRHDNEWGRLKKYMNEREKHQSGNHSAK